MNYSIDDLVFPKLQKMSVNVNGIEVPFVEVPVGSYDRGDATGSEPDAMPVTTIDFKDSFLVGETTVTQELWESVMGNNPSKFKNPQNPVDRVSWETITNEFLPRLNEVLKDSGYEADLLTASEWECAARAGCTQPFPTGESITTSLAQYNTKEPCVVYGKPANVWGISQMVGNVWQWVADNASQDYTMIPTDGTAYIESIHGEEAREAARKKANEQKKDK